MLRRLDPSDLPALLDLSTTAGWNQTPEDWLRLLELEPEGCFGIEEGRRIIASATVITYGEALAWIGMVLTLPEHRGRGHATRLLEQCLDFCAQRGVATVRLDATEMGRPVYERLGFAPEYGVARWSGQLHAAESRAPQFDLDLDRLAFGADRRRLLVKTGWSRPGRVAAYLGPITARTAAEAAAIIRGCGIRGPAFWDIPEPNAAARELAVSLGFAPVRHLVRMRLGPPVQERPEWVFALAGFEYG
ncbi:MAG: N-acetyltransferase [Bryobacteraceae bacterium]|nr:MAG: N-acetyltransferase [Bryobacteraceae bacterium]